MILKEKNFAVQADRRLAAGDAAEKQMAFYLKREFGADKNIWVINDLRIGCSGEFAQLDHVLVSQWGLFVVESKSVTGSVHINSHGEWAREYDGKWEGMPSPVLQAEAQGRILKQLLATNDRILLSRIAGLQKGFGYCPVTVYAAISDSGIIRRDLDLPQVMKADAVAPAIRGWLKNCSLIKELFSMSLEIKPGGWKMGRQEAETVAKFLIRAHTPLKPGGVERPGNPPSARTPTREGLIREGLDCPECGQYKLARKTISRGGDDRREFLACGGYPKTCKAIYPLPAANVAKASNPLQDTPAVPSEPAGKGHKAGDPCPRCKNGTLVERKGKSLFLGCSNYGNRQQKCTFTDYAYKAERG